MTQAASRFVSFVDRARAGELLQTIGLTLIAPIDVALDCSGSLQSLLRAAAADSMEHAVEHALLDWPGHIGDLPDGAVLPLFVRGLAGSVAARLRPQWLVLVQPPGDRLAHWSHELGEHLAAQYCAVLSGWIDEDSGARSFIDVLRRQPMSLAIGLNAAPGAEVGVAISRYSVVDFFAPIRGEGWYEPELVNNVGFRWMRTPGPATVSIPNVFTNDADITLYIPHVLRRSLLRHVRVEINGATLPAALSVRGTTHCLVLRAPLSLLEIGGEQISLSVRIDTANLPADFFQSNDSRPLSIAVSHIEVIEALVSAGSMPAGESAPLHSQRELELRRVNESEDAARYEIQCSGGADDAWNGLLDFRDGELLLTLRARDANIELDIFAEPWLPRDDTGAFIQLPLKRAQAALSRHPTQDREALQALLERMPEALQRLRAESSSSRLRTCASELLAHVRHERSWRTA